MHYKSFETERLIIRPTHTEDADFILELMNTPKWIQFIGDRNLNTVEQASNYITDKMIPQLEKLGYSNYTVIRKEDHKKLGTCGLYNREGLKGIDIGFAFLPQFEGQGYAFEASNRIKEAAFNEFNIKQLKAITLEDNFSSQKLLEKLGLRYTKTITIADDNTPLMLYELKKRPSKKCHSECY